MVQIRIVKSLIGGQDKANCHQVLYLCLFPSQQPSPQIHCQAHSLVVEYCKVLLVTQEPGVLMNYLEMWP